MRAQIAENIKAFKARNPDKEMNMKFLTDLVYNGYTRNRYEVIRRYNRGEVESYNLKILFAICRILDCTIQDLIKYES